MKTFIVWVEGTVHIPVEIDAESADEARQEVQEALDGCDYNGLLDHKKEEWQDWQIAKYRENDGVEEKRP